MQSIHILEMLFNCTKKQANVSLKKKKTNMFLVLIPAFIS